MRRPAWLSVRWWSSRSILTVSLCAFAAVLCILLGSNRYMADCVQQEAQAKDELASLIDTETRSMHLILAAAGQSAEDFSDEPLHRYVARVTETPLSDADSALSAAQKRETARRILYDADYEQAKHEIMSPIERFRQQTSGRLAAEVTRATAGRRSRRFGYQIP